MFKSCITCCVQCWSSCRHTVYSCSRTAQLCRAVGLVSQEEIQSNRMKNLESTTERIKTVVSIQRGKPGCSGQAANMTASDSGKMSSSDQMNSPDSFKMEQIVKFTTMKLRSFLYKLYMLLYHKSVMVAYSGKTTQA